MNEIFNINILSSMLRISTPVTLAAMGGLLCQKAGVFNIALDGMMLIGAFFGIVGVHFSGGNIMAGYLLAMACAMLVSMLYGLVGIKLKANLVYTGLAINMLSLGLTSFILNAFFDMAGSLRPAAIHTIPKLVIPVIRDIPVLAQLFSGQDMMVYAAFILVFVMWIVISKTRFGLAVGRVGGRPEAPRTNGIHPDRIQKITNLIFRAPCGLAGAHLSCDIVSEFSENMVQGRGFTAFTVVAFGNANPFLTFLASLLFGITSALGTRIDIAAIGIPSSLINTFPYLMCIAALVFSASVSKRRSRQLFAQKDQIRAVVFDMDGVLCKSEKTFIAAIRQALLEYGVDAEEEEFRAMSGASDDLFIGAVAEKHGVSYQSAMKERAYTIYEKTAEGNVESFQGMERVIGRLREKGLKTAVASSADRRKVSISLKAVGLGEELFDAIISADQVSEAKPAPDLFIKAAEVLNVTPECCVALDDSPLGIHGAKEAGMKTIAVLTDRQKEEFQEEKPTCYCPVPTECYRWIMKNRA